MIIVHKLYFLNNRCALSLGASECYVVLQSGSISLLYIGSSTDLSA